MVAVIYLVLASAMFFLQDTYFLVGGVEFSLKNPCAVGILFLALLNFIVTVRPGRTIVLVRHTVAQVFPYLIPFLFSAVIWVVSGAESIAIINGVGMIVPQILSVLIAAATLYLFGEKGALYCLGAMCAANFIKVLTVAVEGGIGDFLEEFYLLLVSFSAQNGPLMQQLEINDLTFAFGPFLIYLLLWRKKIPHSFLWFFVTLILFLLGLKRIAIPAVALGFVVAFFVRMLPEKAARQAAMCLAAGMIIVSFMYIVGIRSGLFLYMEEKLGINTMGRVAMFANLEPYYDISITYMGKGTGFERFVDWASGVEYQVPLRTLMPIHNDFLRMYMNIGFAGYWIWIISFLMVRMRYWFRRAGKEAGCLFLGISIYCFVLYDTDNAIYYPYKM
ncbi:MAG: hypothetical protein K2P07_13335, partial [Lachnospiraceae bacterium]|nr:hypothetical protein [Lachnospiraceae bacterium]